MKSEEDPLDSSPAREMRQSMQAIRHLEKAVLDADLDRGIVLRYARLRSRHEHDLPARR